MFTLADIQKEVFDQAKRGFSLQHIGKNFREYHNVKNKRIKKLITDPTEILRPNADTGTLEWIPYEVTPSGQDYLYCDGRLEAGRNAWTKEGSPPYLDIVDNPTNVIHTSTDGAEDGDYTFQDSTRPTNYLIQSVLLDLYCKGEGVYSQIIVKVWNGTSWVEAPTYISPLSSYSWRTTDLTGILNTWTKINGAKIYVKLYKITDTALTLRPNSAGTYQQWDTFGTGTAHWDRTSDQNILTGVQVTGDTALKETENLADKTDEIGPITKVRAYMKARIVGGGGAPEKGVILWRTHGTDYESAEKTISRDSYTEYYEERTTNPNTGLAWTWDEVNALEIGARATTLASGETLQVCEFWIVVTYSVETYVDCARLIVNWKAPSTPTHYDKVDDETPDDDSTYIFTDERSDLHSDLFNLPSTSIPPNAVINNLRVYIRGVARHTGIAIPMFRSMIISHESAYYGANHTDVSVWTTFYDNWANNPFTGLPWTIDEINALMVGANGKSDLTSEAVWIVAAVTQIYVEITYTVPAVVAPAGDSLVWLC